MSFQQTIQKKTGCSGIGLHSGEKVRLNLKPAPKDTGIQFKRLDLPGHPIVHALSANAWKGDYATYIKEQGVAIKTIEHVMSALAGLGVDNLMVELNSSEVPIMDGSAAPFVFLLQEAGLRKQTAKRKKIHIKKQITVTDGDRFVSIKPAKQLKVKYFINYEHPMIRNQEEIFTFNKEQFISRIARARTFGFLRDIEYLKKQGLVQGGSLNNAIVLDNHHIINGDLRFQNEFTSHKIMDLIGDLYLLGHQLVGQISAHKAGHSLHIKLAQKIMEDKTAYSYVEESSSFYQPSFLSKRSLRKVFGLSASA